MTSLPPEMCAVSTVLHFDVTTNFQTKVCYNFKPDYINLVKTYFFVLKS